MNAYEFYDGGGDLRVPHPESGELMHALTPREACRLAAVPTLPRLYDPEGWAAPPPAAEAPTRAALDWTPEDDAVTETLVEQRAAWGDNSVRPHEEAALLRQAIRRGEMAAADAAGLLCDATLERLAWEAVGRWRAEA